MNDTPFLFPMPPGKPEPEKCLHTEVELILTPGTIHYGKEVCVKCGVYIRWIKTPPDALKKKPL